MDPQRHLLMCRVPRLYLDKQPHVQITAPLLGCAFDVSTKYDCDRAGCGNKVHDICIGILFGWPSNGKYSSNNCAESDTCTEVLEDLFQTTKPGKKSRTKAFSKLTPNYRITRILGLPECT